MKIIKEYCPASNVAVLRFNSYGSRLSYFMTLFHEAQKDFPTLDYGSVRVIQFGGERYKRTFGIEFAVDGCPDDYEEISQLEYTL